MSTRPKFTYRPLSSMTLGDYMRWLASTMEKEHAPILRERAKQADDMYAALEAVLNDLREARDTGACSRSRDSQIADIVATLAKARGEVSK